MNMYSQRAFILKLMHLLFNNKLLVINNINKYY